MIFSCRVLSTAAVFGLFFFAATGTVQKPIRLLIKSYNAGKGGGSLPMPPVPVTVRQAVKVRDGGIFETPSGATIEVLIGRSGAETEFAEFRPATRKKYAHMGVDAALGLWKGRRFYQAEDPHAKRREAIESYDLLRGNDGLSLKITAKTKVAMDEGRRLATAIVAAIPAKL